MSAKMLKFNPEEAAEYQNQWNQVLEAGKASAAAVKPDRREDGSCSIGPVTGAVQIDVYRGERFVKWLVQSGHATRGSIDGGGPGATIYTGQFGEDPSGVVQVAAARGVITALKDLGVEAHGVMKF